MKVAITFGGYCPMHQGHLDVIMDAKKENDICYVVVCGYDNEPRAMEIGLDLDTRYRIIKGFFKDDEQVNVIKINDTVLGIDESMSEENWDIWLKAVHAQIPYYIGDCTYYVAEEFYKESLNKRNINCVCLDKVNRVSGTLIRKAPLKYLNKIAFPFRKYFVKNILVIGTASEGKTTLVRDIARYFGIPHAEEYGRDYMAERSMLDTDLTKEDFMQFLIGQVNYTKSCMETTPIGITISDTDNLITLMYAKAYKDNPEMKLTDSDYVELHNMAYALNGSVKWDAIFIIPPGNKFVNDGTRYMGQASIEEREENYNILMGLLTVFGYANELHYLKAGDYKYNFNKVKDYINGILEC